MPTDFGIVSQDFATYQLEAFVAIACLCLSEATKSETPVSQLITIVTRVHVEQQLQGRWPGWPNGGPLAAPPL